MGMNDDVELVICNYPKRRNTSIIKYAQCIFIDIYFADLKKDWQNGWKSQKWGL